MDTATAYKHCEQVTWAQARNFAYGIRLLPPGKRSALAAVYAFARRIDDIGDGTMPAGEKLAALEDAQSSVRNLAGAAASPDDPVLFALAEAARSYPIPLGAFGELIDGCMADVRGTTYATFDELLHYCRCVAGSIGRLSLGVFGVGDQDAAAPLADALGVALQLTNILRDIREDYAAGRVYLPAEDLERFGCTLEAKGTPDARGAAVLTQEAALTQEAPGLARVIEFEAQRARGWYATGMRLMPLLDWRSAACAGAMAGIYRRLLDHIVADPPAVLRGRMSLSRWEKVGVASRSFVSMARLPQHQARPGGTS